MTSQNATRPAPALAASEPRKSDRRGGSIFPRDKVPESETQEPNGNGAYVASDIKRSRRTKVDEAGIDIEQLEFVADWKDELTAKIRRAQLSFELVGLHPDEVELLAAEVAAFKKVCCCLAWRPEAA